MLDQEADPGVAAALLERIAPGLDPPSAVLLESGSTPELTRWLVRIRRGGYRMKVATTPKWGLRLRINAAVATVAARGGVPAPESVRIEEEEGDPGLTVVLETRLGSTNASSVWGRAPRPERIALADEIARALARLHGIPADARILHRSPPTAERWRGGVSAAVERSLDRLRESEALPKNLVGAIAERLRRCVERFPPAAPVALCHGSLRLATIGLEKRALAGFFDFEHARAGDPLADAVHLVVTTGEPDGAFARRFLATYLAAAPAVAQAGGVEDRIAAYTGLDLLQALRRPGAAESPDTLATFVDLLEVWVDGALT